LAARCVVLGWSGADWSFAQPLLAAGELPGLAKLIASGAKGSIRGFAPFHPALSWTAVATGTHPDVHPAQPARLWTQLAQQGLRSAALSWPGSPEQIPAGWSAAMLSVSVSAAQVDPKLLGLFIPQLSRIPVEREARPQLLIQLLAELYTTHNRAVVLAREGAVDFFAIGYRFLREVTEAFLAVREDPLYREVIPGAYRLMDLLLTDLLRRCGPDARVFLTSDHGYGTNSRRAYGLLIMRAPDYEPGSAIRGLTLADLAPAIRRSLGLSGEDGPPAACTPEAVDADLSRAVGTALVELDRPADAVAWLHRSALAYPESAAVAGLLAQSLLQSGLLAEAELAAGPVFDAGADAPQSLLLQAQLALGRGQPSEALTFLARLEPGSLVGEPEAIRRRALLDAGENQAAEAAFLAALRAEPDEPLLHVGLGYAHFGRKNFSGAREAAARALGLDPGQQAALRLLEKIRAAEINPAAAPTSPVDWNGLMVEAAQRKLVRTSFNGRQAQAQAARRQLRGCAPVHYLSHPVPLSAAP